MMAIEELDIDKLYQEAQNRWLKPAEVHFLLQNYEKQHLMQENPQNPPSGSLFLFNRRVHRFFRKDGYAWRKKRDGRTVGEAHERLKVGNVDALNCYYAHGEQNPNFQRRCFWMLAPAWDHIVLVHYREVTEGRHNGGSTLSFSTESSSPFSQSAVYNARIPNGQNWSSLSPGESVGEVSSKLASGNMYLEPHDVHSDIDIGASSEQEVNHALRRLEEQLSLDNDADAMSYMEKLPPYSNQDGNSKYSGTFNKERVRVKHSSKQDDIRNIMLPQYEGVKMDLYGQHSTVESWTDMLEMFPSPSGINPQGQGFDKLLLKGVLDSSKGKSLSSSEKLQHSANVAKHHERMTSKWHQSITSEQNGNVYCSSSEKSLSRQLSETRRFLLESDDPIDSSQSELLQEVENTFSTYSSGASSHEATSKGLTPHEVNSVNWMEARPGLIGSSNKFSPGYYETWFDQESHLGTPPLAPDVSLTLAEVQRFHIREVSPEWAYSGEQTKVIITGDFLCSPSECSWACMFGDVEVSVEVIQEGVLRCLSPQHSSGWVSFCLTSGNREACSEVREFEFQPEPQTSSLGSIFQQREENKTKEELALLLRFVGVLRHGFDSVTVQKEDSVESGTELFKKWIVADDPWGHIIEALIVGNATSIQTLEWMVEELLKDKLQSWALSKVQYCDGVTDSSLSKQEQGMIHMIAALGYEWALSPILSSGVGINFRDINGWTALHWAARFGREKMVAALVAAGASAGAVTDPTSQNLSGNSPATIAATRGHKGLAGYLSEVALTSHLYSLTLEENEISKCSAAVEAERTLEIVSDRSEQLPITTTEDQLSLKDSLAAVRNSAQAAARIQAAFRAHSFHKRQQRAASSFDEYGLTPDGISVLSKFQRGFRSLPAHKINNAVLSIQKNYRGWKGRKEFLNLRRNVVKIQAHVRGHQVRKKYKVVIWAVGVLEKAILRWRRRGMGLRGFKSEQEPTEGNVEEEEEEDILKVFRKQKVHAAVDEDVARVLSMSDSAEARQQYRRMRMLESSQQAKAELGNHGCESRLTSQGNDDNMENEDYMYHFS
ncbi:calmodulin-binding transcription activator 4-like isoform X2 [Aristolochia californica]|uniref:calmodulin-binding transcription activator 4-like isoform X2 n=1 Tax=Aristolochia californica TaxID=171875 RepID=UPI0035DDC425